MRQKRPLDGDGDGVAGYDIGVDEVLPYGGAAYLPVVLKG
jgi:hypothetical protein